MTDKQKIAYFKENYFWLCLFTSLAFDLFFGLLKLAGIAAIVVAFYWIYRLLSHIGLLP